jgi:putative oxidoreductase
MEMGLLLLRLTAGLTLAAHGAQKLFGWFGRPGLEATGQFFETKGCAAPEGASGPQVAISAASSDQLQFPRRMTMITDPASAMKQ